MNPHEEYAHLLRANYSKPAGASTPATPSRELTGAEYGRLMVARYGPKRKARDADLPDPRGGANSRGRA